MSHRSCARKFLKDKRRDVLVNPAGWGSPILVDWIELADKSVFRILHSIRMFAPERVDIHTATSSADISIHDAYSCRQGTSIENPGRSLTTIQKTIIATEKHHSSQSKENIEPNYWQNTHPSVHDESTRDQMMII